MLLCSWDIYIYIWCCNPFVMNLTFYSCVGRVVCSFAFANSIFSWEKHTGKLPADVLQYIPIFLGDEPASSKDWIRHHYVQSNKQWSACTKNRYPPLPTAISQPNPSLFHTPKNYMFMSKIMGQHPNTAIALYQKIRWLCHLQKCA